MSTVAVSRITSKGQVTIPRAIREELRLDSGDTLEWTTAEDGHIEVRKLEGRLEDMAGLLGIPRRPLTLEEMDEGIRARFRRRNARR